MIKDLSVILNIDETHKIHQLTAISIVDVSVDRSLFAIIETPELSFGSAVLFGQTIIKVVSGFAYTKPTGAELRGRSLGPESRTTKMVSCFTPQTNAV